MSPFRIADKEKHLFYSLSVSFSSRSALRLLMVASLQHTGPSHSLPRNPGGCNPASTFCNGATHLSGLHDPWGSTPASLHWSWAWTFRSGHRWLGWLFRCCSAQGGEGGGGNPPVCPAVVAAGGMSGGQWYSLKTRRRKRLKITTLYWTSHRINKIPIN